MIPLQRQFAAVAAGGLVLLLAGCAANDSFAKLDSNRDGSGSRAEFDAYMKSEVFARIDQNSDGRVTKQEWQQFNPGVTDAKFRSTDLNGDGFIDRAEADAAFDREGSLKKLFAQIDTDGDGSLSPAEVAAFRTKVRQQPGSSPVEKLSNAANPS